MTTMMKESKAQSLSTPPPTSPPSSPNPPHEQHTSRAKGSRTVSAPLSCLACGSETGSLSPVAVTAYVARLSPRRRRTVAARLWRRRRCGGGGVGVAGVGGFLTVRRRAIVGIRGGRWLGRGFALRGRCLGGGDRWFGARAWRRGGGVGAIFRRGCLVVVLVVVVGLGVGGGRLLLMLMLLLLLELQVSHGVWSPGDENQGLGPGFDSVSDKSI
jgi:hypothetical protein